MRFAIPRIIWLFFLVVLCKAICKDTCKSYKKKTSPDALLGRIPSSSFKCGCKADADLSAI